MTTRPGRDLITPEWFQWMSAPASRGAKAQRIGAAVGLLIGILLIANNRIILGAIAIAIALFVGISSFLSPALAQKVDRVFDRIGTWLARIISWTLLTPLFVIVFTAVRVWHRIVGQDPLRLRETDEPSYWIPSDAHARKVRYANAMFASERVQRRGLGLVAIGLLLLVAAVLSEGLLRFWGFGKPILYLSDAQIGFYPMPNQATNRQGGRVTINSFGMRAPDYAAKKPEGVFRVLMLGDSTLYGGSYVDQNELYSRRLEEHLRKAARGRRVEVLAMGVNAWGPFHELGYVEKFGTFDADLAIVALPIGDIYRPLYGLEAVPFLSAQRPPRLAFEELVNHLAWRLRTTQIGPPPKEQVQWQGERGLEAYARLAQLLSDRGAEVMFQVLPYEDMGVGRKFIPSEVRDVNRLRATLGGRFHLTYPAGVFKGVPGVLYHDGVHLHVDGHRVYSEFLEKDIAANSAKWKEWVALPRMATAGVIR